jgi:hypothetical protein
MPFPGNHDELVAAGFERIKDRIRQTICRGKDCRARIQWWETPRHKTIPLNDADLSPHWATCPNADDFRRRGRVI